MIRVSHRRWRRFAWLAASVILALAGWVALRERASAVTLDDLWLGTAHFEEVGEIDWVAAPHGSIGESSSWFTLRSGVWYAFNRLAMPDPGGECPSTHMQIVVRESRDQGRSWSDAEIAAAPGDSVHGDGCAVLDGSSYFDAATGVWHLLAQCSDDRNQGGWAMCHYTRKSASPMGRFRPDPGNPVVKGGDLWRRICDRPGSACPSTTVDEGTPEIISRSGGQFLVTFHGFDYGSKKAFRGLASTPDFMNWQTEGPGLPGGAMLGASECRPQLPNCVGVGQATTLFTDQYLYVLAEAMDMSLQCLPNQQWQFYLYRSPRGAFPRSGSGKWQPYPGSALLKPSSSDPATTCKVTYARWIQDGNTVYLVYEDRITNSVYLNRRLLKLVPGRGVAVRLRQAS